MADQEAQPKFNPLVYKPLDERTDEEKAFLEKKWRHQFRCWDADNDKTLSFQDFELIAARFIDNHKLDDENAEKIKGIMKEIWEMYYGQEDTVCTEDEFVENFEMVGSDKEAYQQHLEEGYEIMYAWYDIIDVNNDGEICVDEYKTFFKCFRVSPKAAEIAFQKMDSNNDGVLDRDEFLNAAREYWDACDPTLPGNFFWGDIQ